MCEKTFHLKKVGFHMTSTYLSMKNLIILDVHLLKSFKYLSLLIIIIIIKIKIVISNKISCMHVNKQVIK